MSAVAKQVEIDELNNRVKTAQPQIEIERRHRVVRRVNKQKKRGLYSIQGLAILAAFGMFGLLFGQLYLDSQISRVHYQTQELRLDISSQTVVNQQLYSKIAELSMYSRIVEVAEAHGLDYQDNIISIGQ